MTDKKLVVRGVLIVMVAVLLGFVAGRINSQEQIRQAREAEYVRVVEAIARTMRCSDEIEYSKGQDHECDPSEIEQDAGLVDADGAENHQPRKTR